MKRLVLLLIALLCCAPLAGATELADYGNQVTFTVNNTPWVGTVSNYAVKYILSNASGISGYYGGDNIIYTNGSTRADWADIRPTDESDNALPFWPETNTQTAVNQTVWVRHSTISAGNTTLAKWYYGNSSQSTSTANGYNTFPLLFDDFPGSSVNTTIWANRGSYGTVGVASGIMTITSTYWDYFYVQSISANGFSFGRNVSQMLRYKSGHHASGTYFEMPGFRATGGGYNSIGGTFSTAGGGGFDTWAPGGASIWSGYAANTWYVVSFDRNFSSTNFRINNVTSTYAATDTTTYLVSFETASASTGAVQYVDWICVRPYYDPEPFTSNYSQSTRSPVASFTTNVSSGAAPLAVKLTDTSPGTPTSWNWSVTDYAGNSTEIWFSTTQNPTIVLPVGNHLFSLNASNSYGYSVSATKRWVNVTSEIAPLTMFTNNYWVVLFPKSIQFNDTSTNTPTAWNWSFGDGTYSNVQNATHQYVKRGRWTVLLNASNTAGFNTNTTTIWVLGG